MSGSSKAPRRIWQVKPACCAKPKSSHAVWMPFGRITQEDTQMKPTTDPFGVTTELRPNGSRHAGVTVTTAPGALHIE